MLNFVCFKKVGLIFSREEPETEPHKMFTLSRHLSHIKMMRLRNTDTISLFRGCAFLKQKRKISSVRTGLKV
jgi:hypothetical protein